jgi:hypothetical protein
MFPTMRISQDNDVFTWHNGWQKGLGSGVQKATRIGSKSSHLSCCVDISIVDITIVGRAGAVARLSNSPVWSQLLHVPTRTEDSAAQSKPGSQHFIVYENG